MSNTPRSSSTFFTTSDIIVRSLYFHLKLQCLLSNKGYISLIFKCQGIMLICCFMGNTKVYWSTETYSGHSRPSQISRTFTNICLFFQKNILVKIVQFKLYTLIRFTFTRLHLSQGLDNSTASTKTVPLLS